MHNFLCCQLYILSSFAVPGNLNQRGVENKVFLFWDIYGREFKNGLNKIIYSQ